MERCTSWPWSSPCRTPGRIRPRSSAPRSSARTSSACTPSTPGCGATTPKDSSPRRTPACPAGRPDGGTMSPTMSRRGLIPTLAIASVALGGCSEIEPARTVAPAAAASVASDDLDAALRAYLTSHGFTGHIASTLETRLGRRIDRQLADIGRQLWFDPIHALNGDNTCGGCHSPTNGFGDTQPIAIGIDNNRIVGSGRTGPRNQRRSPMAINAAFYPTLMWNSRFSARSGDPFDNSQGFVFPAPEGMSLSYVPHLLTAQAFIPSTERVEAAGFHFPGNNDDIRGEVLRRLNATESYRDRFARVFPHVKAGAPITFDDFGRAIAEFEFTPVFANAP